MSILMLCCLWLLSQPKTSVVEYIMEELQPWDISWPVFSENEFQHSVMNGYGDWWYSDPPHGPHPGIDLIPDVVDNPPPYDTLEWVLSPVNDERVITRVGSSPTGGVLGIGLQQGSNGWWDLGHLDLDDPGVEPFELGDELSPSQILAPVVQEPVPDWVPHLHLAWNTSHTVEPVPGYWNPFECFEDGDLNDYDEVVFTQPYYHEHNFNPQFFTGVYFMPDGVEAPRDFPSAPSAGDNPPDPVIFQRIISGNVDIAVAPHSAFHGDPVRDSSGVYQVGYTIAWMNPYTEVWEPTASDVGEWGAQRVLMQMKGELPYGDSDGFRAIFLDGLWIGGGEADDCFFENGYVVTNCGALDPSDWEAGWDNVATAREGFSDWESAICQGMWDTNLADYDELNPVIAPADVNAEALFPEGLYAVDVTAISHGSRSVSTIRMPVEDVTDPESQVLGIIVDNFKAHVSEAHLFVEYADRSGGEVEYSAAWITGLDPAIDEETRDLELQLEEIRNPGSYLPLQEYTFSLNGTPGIPCSDFIQSNQELIPPLCAMERVEQSSFGIEYESIDPVSFIQSRIDSLRGLDSHELRYLVVDVEEYPDLSQGFGIMVKYSEPMMESAPEGREVIDQIWLEGTQGDEVVWDSRNSGYFQAQEPMCWTDVEGMPPEPAWDAGRLKQAEGFWREYEFVGEPPGPGFHGLLTLCIGCEDISDEFTGPRDLAGDVLDGDPETVCSTRDGYGPWINASGPVPRYEPKVDRHYSWGELHWTTPYPGDQYFNGYCEEDLIKSIDLVEIGVGRCERFYGDCGYNCGFWVYQSKHGFRGFEIQTILPDETYRSYRFSTLWPVEEVSFQYPWWTPWDSARSDDGRYCWMSGFDCANGTSTGYIYAVDAATGAVLSADLCSGCYWGQYDWTLAASFVKILDVYSTGHALLRCMYYQTVGGEPVIEYRLLAPPASRPFESECIDGEEISGTGPDDPIVRLQSNPVESTIGIILDGYRGDRFESVLYDVSGRLILDQTCSVELTDGSFQIDVSGIPSGIYYLVIEGDQFSEQMSVTIIH